MATRKVTISLPNHVLRTVDSLIGQHGQSRSAVIAAILDEKLMEVEAASMKEGYLAMAKENVREAEESLTLTREVILRNG